MNTETFLNDKITLTNDQIDQLVDLLTKRCGQNAKTRIRSMVTYDLSTLLGKHWGLSRFYIYNKDNSIHYCAGQDHSGELRTIRNDLMRMFP